MREKNLLITLNIGNRPYLQHTQPFMELYANKCHADFKVISKNILPHPLPKMKYRRPNISAYIMKLYVVFVYLEKYDKVMFIDDTYIIKSDMPDIFSLENDTIYGANTYPVCADSGYDEEFINNTKNYNIDRNSYINTGMFLIPKIYRKYFSWDMIQQNINLFQSSYPSQAYFNYIVQYHNIKVDVLDVRYNYLKVRNDSFSSDGSIIMSKFIEHDISYCYHITGYYKSRYNLIRNICNYLLSNDY